jgi:serine/threonine protein kinase
MRRRRWVSCNNRLIGTLLNQYRLDEIVGEGGMGVVYRALDMNLERAVAVKVLGASLREDADFVARFRQEARIQAGLNHPNIATLFDFFVWDDMPVAVMEFIKGETLRALVDRSGPLPAHIAIPIFIQTLRGVAAGHKVGIIHRDLKPSNLMITDEGMVKITDFGIAKVRNNTGLTRVSTRVGSTSYMAPEQILGRPVDERTDIYILGGTLFELLTGRPPFQGLSQFEIDTAHVREPPRVPTEFYARIPPPVIDAVIRALAKQPSDRFASAEEFIAALPELYGMPYVAPVDDDATRIPQRMENANLAAPPPEAVVAEPAAPRPKTAVSEPGVPRTREVSSQRIALDRSAPSELSAPQAHASELTLHRAEEPPQEATLFRAEVPPATAPVRRAQPSPSGPAAQRAEAAESEPTLFRAEVSPTNAPARQADPSPSDLAAARAKASPPESTSNRGRALSSEATVYRADAPAPDPTIFRGEAPPSEPTEARAVGAKRAVTIAVASGLLVFLVVGIVLFATRRPVTGTAHRAKQLPDTTANVPVGPQPSAHEEPTVPPAPIPQESHTLGGLWTATYLDRSGKTLLQLVNLQLQQADNGAVTGRFDYKTSDAGGEECTLEKSSYSTDSKRLRLITHCHDPHHPKYLNVPLEFDNVDPAATKIEGGRLAFHLADDIVVTLQRTSGT